MSFNTTLYYFKECFFPSGCGGCGKAFYNPLDAYYGLCEECRSFFGGAFVLERRCRSCGKPLISEKEFCLSCRGKDKRDGRDEPVSKLWALFPYAGKFKGVLGSFKFEKSTGLGNFFAQCLKIAIEDLDPAILKKTAWVPVPPRPGKLKKQGWDQIELLAKRLAKAGSIPVRRCLKRLPSRSQKELNREERETNLKGRIRCAKKPPETAILFDDVITTGATIGACAAALLEGGAKAVYAVCLFYD
jgi:ComF family protein